MPTDNQLLTKIEFNQRSTPVGVTSPPGLAYISTATITRAENTTPYSINDVIGGAFELTALGANAGNIILTGIDLEYNVTALPSGLAGIKLYLYSVTPPSAIADNTAFSYSSGDRASCLTPDGISLGSLLLATGGGTVVLSASNLNLQFKLSGTSLFGYLVTVHASGTWTPAANSETLRIRARSLGV